jgi:hypothetical protein
MNSVMGKSKMGISKEKKMQESNMPPYVIKEANENCHRFIISLQANNLTSLSPYAADLTDR